MRDSDVFGFTRAVAHNCVPASLLSHPNGFNSLTKGADLVGLNQDSVGGLFVDGALKKFGVGNEQIIANQLDFTADRFVKLFPTVPVIFG